jgi:hypothetical protein
MNLNMIKSKIAHASGTGNFYHGMNKGSVYTDGVKEFLKLAECQWLYDIIQSEVHIILRMKIPDTYYFRITVNSDSEATLELTDYNGDDLWKREIPYTDFPEGSMDLITGWDGERLTTCLPSEN